MPKAQCWLGVRRVVGPLASLLRSYGRSTAFPWEVNLSTARVRQAEVSNRINLFGKRRWFPSALVR